MNRLTWILAFVVTMAVFAFGAILQSRSTAQATTFAEIEAEHANALQVLVELGHLNEALSDAQRGTRGFLLTNDKRYLDPYYNGLREAPRQLDQLAQHLSYDKTQAEHLLRLRTITTEALNLYSRTVGLAQNGRYSAAVAVVRTGEGKRYMDEARSIMTAMEKRADQERVSRRAHADAVTEAAVDASRLMTAFGTMLFLLLLGAGFAAYRTRTRAMVAEGNLRSMRQVKESEERFRTLANCMPVMVWTSEPDGYLDYYNDKWYDYTGRPRGEGGDQSWEPILHPDDLQLCLDTWYQAVGDGVPYQIEYRFKQHSTGVFRWHLGQATPIRDENGIIIKWYGTCTDIHDMKQAQEVLKAREAQLNTIIETVPVGLVLAELPSGKVLGGNKYVEQMLRHPVIYSPDVDSYDEWVSYHADGTRVDGHEYPLARMVRDGEESPSIDVHYQRGDGTRAWTRIMGRPVKDQHGKITGGVVALIDIDEQERSRAALEEALEAKDLLLYEVNHRVKNSLQLVNSVLAIEASKLAPNKGRAAIMAARRKVDVVARLHQRLYMGGAHDRVDLKTALEETGRELLLSAGRADVSLNVTYGGDPMIHIRQASPLMLAVNEILTNAVKYGLSAKEPQLTISAENLGGELKLEITDNGPGFPAPEAGTKAGLGMQIITSLTSQMRGTVTTSNNDPGARFVLAVPSKPHDSQQKAMAA